MRCSLSILGPPNFETAENEVVMASSHIRQWPSYKQSPTESPGQSSANHHASSRAREVHVRCPTTRPAPPACMKTMTQASRPPFCGTQLAEICGVEHEVRVTSGAPRLSAPYNCAQLGPPGLEGLTPPRRRGAPGGKKSQEEAYVLCTVARARYPLGPHWGITAPRGGPTSGITGPRHGPTWGITPHLGTVTRVKLPLR